MDTGTGLWTTTAGRADGVPLVLLHGMGATAETTLDDPTAAVASTVPDLDRAVVLGHPLGGCVALGLATAPPDVVRAADPDAVVVPGAGHNLHVEAPGALLDLARRVGAVLGAEGD